MCADGTQMISLNIIMSRLSCLSSHSLHTLSENSAASQAVVGATVMSNSFCYSAAAAQSKSLSVGHLI